DILRTTSYISRKEKAHLIISAWSNLCSFKKLVKLHHLTVSDSNIASSHNTAYQECINTLLCNLSPLSASVNEFVQEFYRNLYEKLEKLAEFEGGELCFPQLQIIVPLRSGQVKFDDVYDNLKNRIERNADRHNVLFIKHQNLNNAQGLNSRT
ncbi:425_t:CDS:2, partial [Scutellospora calospora]